MRNCTQECASSESRRLARIINQLKQENAQLKELACERCKRTNMAFACKVGDKKCIAFKESEGEG